MRSLHSKKPPPDLFLGAVLHVQTYYEFPVSAESSCSTKAFRSDSLSSQ